MRIHAPPARLGHTREQTRGHGLQAISRMAQATWHQLARAKLLHVTLVADATPIPLMAASLTITVNPVDPASGRTFGRTKLDGGQSGIYVVERLGLLAMLGLAARLVLGRRNAALRERRASSVNIASCQTAAMEVMNDGELVWLTPPLHYRLRPRAPRVLVSDRREA